VDDVVLGRLGWQTHALSDGTGLKRLDPSTAQVPLQTYLGAVGMPGVTAHVGIFDIGVPKVGETLVISAATGAVGSIAGQLAKMGGSRVVGIAGSERKCAVAVDQLRLDACIDHRAPDFEAKLADATPHGIDVYFDNVGGRVLDAVLPRMNDFGRIPLCGQVSQYNATSELYGVRNVGALLAHRVKLQGFIVGDHPERWPAAVADLSKWVSEGRLQVLETMAEGLARAPRAFIGMLRGENLGKQLVKLA
jgi:NADPH-dependent curcumin reductase CurA